MEEPNLNAIITENTEKHGKTRKKTVPIN